VRRAHHRNGKNNDQPVFGRSRYCATCCGSIGVREHQMANRRAHRTDARAKQEQSDSANASKKNAKIQRNGLWVRLLGPRLRVPAEHAPALPDPIIMNAMREFNAR
jgi:hypothetical protein